MFELFKKGREKSNRWVLGLMVITACYVPASAWAVLPSADDVADGADTTSPMQMLRDLFSGGMGIAATIVAAVLVLGTVWQIYSAYNESVKKGEWKHVAITASLGIGVIVGGIILAVLANTYGTF